MKNFHGAISKRYRIRPLEKINHGGSVFMTVDTDVTAGFYAKYPHPQLAALHALDLGSQVNDLFCRRFEPLIALRSNLLRIGDLWCPT